MDTYRKEIKQAVVTYGLQFVSVKEMVKTWASSIKAMPHDWLQLVSTVLDDGPQLNVICEKRQKF